MDPSPFFTANSTNLPVVVVIIIAVIDGFGKDGSKAYSNAFRMMKYWCNLLKLYFIQQGSWTL